jgi:hypothetical protein
MRIVAGCLIVAAASFGLAPSSPELHNRYGLSDWERFTVRPGITATVQYGADHLACQIQIEPYQPLIHQYDQTFTLISSKDMADILEELAPVATRGKVINHGSFQASCGVGNFDEYDKVTIMRGMSACAPADARDVNTEIVFKREICPNVKLPYSFKRLDRP